MASGRSARFGLFSAYAWWEGVDIVTHSPPVAAPTFRDIWSQRSTSELAQIAKVKRFVERYVGDVRFREALVNADDPSTLGAAFGVEIDVNMVRCLYPSSKDDQVAPPPESLQLWWDYSDDISAFLAATREMGDPGDCNESFSRWRRRHIRRVDSECGRTGMSIVHPLVAFELSDGCSVGCWFCGVSAQSLRTVWPYTPANAAMWRGILEVFAELFGPAVSSGFLYWATEPFDNPDYPRFLRDFTAITGRQAQTTTAVPLRDLELTADVMGYFDEYQHVANRFSLLTRSALSMVHQTWSPMELLGVELVPQMPGSLMTKGMAGRARQHAGRAAADRGSLEQGTIACVTGFLVNLARGEVSLVSPTIAGQRWPDGYKIWGERRFGSIASLHDAVASLIVEEVDTTPAATERACFRSDLDYQPATGGFDLASASHRHTVRGPELVTAVGEAIAAQRDTFGGLRRRLVGQGADPLALEAVLDDLFSSGLLAEPIDLQGPPDHGSDTSLVRLTTRTPGG